jgi:hypothetical protein
MLAAAHVAEHACGQLRGDRVHACAFASVVPITRLFTAGKRVLVWQVKTRLQTGSAHGSVPRVMASIVAAEGGLALFSGWTAAVVRAFPANAGLFLGVEVSIRAMKRWLD